VPVAWQEAPGSTQGRHMDMNGGWTTGNLLPYVPDTGQVGRVAKFLNGLQDTSILGRQVHFCFVRLTGTLVKGKQLSRSQGRRGGRVGRERRAVDVRPSA
jgi:hypothetical protein